VRPGARLLVDGDLSLESGATSLRVRGAGDRVEIHFDRWRDLFALRSQRPAARIAHDIGFEVDVHVRGLRLPRWMIR